MLYEKLKADLINAMKARRESDISVLRMLTAALQNRAIEKRTKSSAEPLTEEEVVEVLRREAKKRREAAALFARGGRPELESNENSEADFIETYLPKQLDAAQVEAVVKRVLATGVSKLGDIMKETMKELKGKADGRLVQAVIKKLKK